MYADHERVDREAHRLRATYDRLVGEVLEANALEGASISLTGDPSIGEMQDALARHRGREPFPYHLLVREDR